MSESVKHYLNRLSESSRPSVEFCINKFMTWLGENSDKFGNYTPDMLIEYQKNNPGTNEVLDLIQDG